MTATAEFVYVARRPCGCASGFTVDYADAETAQDVAAFIASGRSVDRVTLEVARDTRYVSRCDHAETP